MNKNNIYAIKIIYWIAENNGNAITFVKIMIEDLY
jgi:hypothetical protein